MDRLTPRQMEVVQLVSKDLSNKEIAEKLGISEKTVKQHLHAIFRKLKVKNRIDVIAKYHFGDWRS